MSQIKKNTFRSVTMTYLLISVFLLLITQHSCRNFCNSACIDYINACFDIGPNDCYVCANSIYQPKDFSNPLNSCVEKNQRSVLFSELNSNAMSLTGYTTTVAAPFVCSNLTFSGQYVNTDFIEKNFTNILTEHYELIIRFGVGYIGTWTNVDRLQIQIDDGHSTQYYKWNYSCGQLSLNASGVLVDDAQNLCSAQMTDCVRIKQFTIQHNSSFVNLKISSLTSQTNSNIQSWGIKDLIIAVKTCHSYCDKCFGQAVSQCLTCSDGYFLRGNTCILKCPKFAILSTQQCVDSCPMGYYHNYLNDYCEVCLKGCSMCTTASLCLLWGSKDPTPSLWDGNLELWIILIIAAVGIIAFLIWKFVIKKYFQIIQESNMSSSDQVKEKNTDQGLAQIKKQTDQMQEFRGYQNITNQLWIQNLDNVDPVKVDIRKRKRRIANFNTTLNSSQTIF